MQSQWVEAMDIEEILLGTIHILRQHICGPFPTHQLRQHKYLGNVHKGRPTIMGHFGHTYLHMSHVFYIMPITLFRFFLRYVPTPKLDVLYESSLVEKQSLG